MTDRRWTDTERVRLALWLAQEGDTGDADAAIHAAYVAQLERDRRVMADDLDSLRMERWGLRASLDARARAVARARAQLRAQRRALWALGWALFAALVWASGGWGAMVLGAAVGAAIGGACACASEDA